MYAVFKCTYLLEHCNEQVDQKNVCNEKVAGHNGRC